MASLKQLMNFAKEYNIPLSKMTFYGEHDVVYLDFPEGFIPYPNELPEEGIEYVLKEFGIDNIEDRWGFYT